MHTHEHRVQYGSRKDQFDIYPLGDIHAGVVHCAEKQIKSKVREISENPFALWIGMGDLADCITPADRRWDDSVIAPWVDRQNIAESCRKWLVNLFAPIKDKCIGILEGNHELTMRKTLHVKLTENICGDLGVPYLGYSCFVLFKFSRLKGGSVTSLIGHFSHGSGWAQTEQGVANRLKKNASNNVCDFHASGHLHRIYNIEDRALVLKNTNGNGFEIAEAKRPAVCTGSWLQSYKHGEYPSYAEQRGYDPTPIGCPIISITPDKGLIEVTT